MSKQLESIMKRMPVATPPAALKVVMPQVEATEPQPETKPEDASRAPASPPTAKKTGAKREAVKQAATAPAAAEPERSIQAYVPLSIAKALNMRAAEEDVTVRTLILQGLQAIGFEISPEQIRDRRKQDGN
ncbi:hypothetical protein MesoLj131b_76730 (plasmid) [Mesorhizobium sp. 131-2-5]|uniref:hypothetical protein n=1 Tax=Mesorhizobium sp. 131-2-5 TaxID=2744519 RepID=UPI0018ECC96B|nr:hypothetical protein [Mesorhizobium sp. 131-2-5]BCH05674.1 hypothetical protein MesoLj131b_76730 [Mesorhizobium sp. 131-2-5]